MKSRAIKIKPDCFVKNIMKNEEKKEISSQYRKTCE